MTDSDERGGDATLRISSSNPRKRGGTTGTQRGNTTPGVSRRYRTTQARQTCVIASAGDLPQTGGTVIDLIFDAGQSSIVDVHAFLGCEGVETAVIPEGVHRICRHAFAQCESLIWVQLPRSLRIIDPHAFSGCVHLESVTIPSGCQRIDVSAFLRCKRLASVHLPDSVRHIGPGAFEECTGLLKVRLPKYRGEGGVKISARAFKGSGLVGVDIPAPVATIWDGAFAGCANLSSVSLPDTVTTLKPDSFAECTNLHSIRIPGPAMVEGAFRGCEHLSVVECPNAKYVFGTEFTGCPRIRCVVAPIAQTRSNVMIKSLGGVVSQGNTPENRLIARGLRFWSRQTHALCSPRLRAKVMTFVLAVRTLATRGIVVPEAMWLSILEHLER